MSTIENEYTFTKINTSKIPDIIEKLDERFGKHKSMKYKKTSIKDGDKVYRLVSLDKKKMYQIKEKVGYLNISHDEKYVFITRSIETPLLDTKIKKTLLTLDKNNDDFMKRVDWMNSSISLRYNDKTAYLEYEIIDNDDHYKIFKDIYKIIYNIEYINGDHQNKALLKFNKYIKTIKNPIPIQKNRHFVINLYMHDFIVRPKTDGVHALLFNIERSTYIWFLNNIPIKISFINLGDLVMEVEYIQETNKIVYIDTLNSDDDDFMRRYLKAKKRFKSKIVFRKVYHFKESKHDLLKKFDDIRQTQDYKKFKSDGLIIHSSKRYTSENAFVYKLKIGNENTIDMILKDDGFYVSYGRDSGMVLFEGTDDHPFEFQSSDYSDYPHNVVAEWMYDTKIEKFIFLRERDDKLYPNIQSTAVSNWESIFMDIAELFGSDSTKRVNYIINEVKGNLINHNASAFFDLGSGSAGPMKRYPSDKMVIFTEIDDKNIEEAHKRLKRARVQNIAMEKLDYLDHEELVRIWNKYMTICNNGVQVTNFITITHQSKEQIPDLHKMWKFILSHKNVSKITMIIINGQEILYMKRKGVLKDLGVNIKHIKGDMYNTQIGKTTTANFDEYLYDMHLYFNDLENDSDIEVEISQIKDHINMVYDYLNESELEWLNAHYVVQIKRRS